MHKLSCTYLFEIFRCLPSKGNFNKEAFCLFLDIAMPIGNVHDIGCAQQSLDKKLNLQIDD